MKTAKQWFCLFAAVLGILCSMAEIYESGGARGWLFFGMSMTVVNYSLDRLQEMGAVA